MGNDLTKTDGFRQLLRNVSTECDAHLGGMFSVSVDADSRQRQSTPFPPNSHPSLRRKLMFQLWQCSQAFGTHGG